MSELKTLPALQIKVPTINFECNLLKKQKEHKSKSNNTPPEIR